MNEEEFCEAVLDGELEKVRHALSLNPGFVQSKEDDGRTALHIAASGGGLEHALCALVELLLSKGARITATDSRGWTPLHEAESKEVAAAILAKASWLRRRSIVNARGKRGATPLHVAATQNRKDVVEFLLSKGADVNAKSQGGTTPLRWAAVEGNRGIVEILRLHGASEDVSDIS